MNNLLKRTVSVITSAALSFVCTYIPSGSSKTSALKIGEGFRYEIIDGEAVITAFDNTRDPVTVIPEEIDGVPVTTIRSLFGNIKEIVIPPSVKKVESKAFKGNFLLEKVVFSENTTELGEDIFESCDRLKYCEFKGNIEELPAGTFYDCPMLSEVVLPDTLKNIGGRAFSGCSSLKEIDIPDSMTELPFAIFRECSSLTSIDIPEGVTYIGNSVFKDCSSLKEIIIPDGVTYIGEYAFSGCSSLQKLNIPQNVEILNDGLAADCTSLTEITLPKTAKSYESKNSTRIFGRDMFRNCEKLTSITIPYGIRDIGEKCFDGCTSLKELKLPDTISIIDNYAFRNCSSLEELDIPGPATIYGNETFCGCSSLKSLYIPETTVSFSVYGGSTFKDCVSLEELYLPVNTKLNYYDVFEGCNSLKDLYIGAPNATFGGKYLGYIYDKETDTYTKNEELTIYCREGSTAHKYALDNGFKYEILYGFEPYLVYVGSGNNEEDYSEESINETEAAKAFVTMDGEYIVSQQLSYTDLGNEAIFIIYTGLDDEMLSAADADVIFEPTVMYFAGKDLTEVYDEITYQMVTEEGYHYLVITCLAEEGNDVSALGLRSNWIHICFNSYIVPAGEYTYGDIDNNGTVNAADFVLIKKYLLGIITSDEIYTPAADFNNDGTINILDLILFKSMMLED